MIWLNTLIAGLLPLIPRPLVRIFARQYIAGETLHQAIAKIRELNRQHISATLDLLGEDPKTKNDCTSAAETYRHAIRKINENRLSSGISLKPSQMGLKLDEQFCYDTIRSIAETAKKHGVFIRIDMEDVSLKEKTIAIFLKLKKEYDNIGIVVQAYTRSGIEDIRQMVLHRANVRLCKGAYYWEGEKDVYKDMAIINKSYAYLLEKLFSGNCFAGIATHDEAMVFEALKLIDKLGVPTGQYEFQMLYGVERGLRRILVDQGHPVRVYVPFGKEWFAYSVRRLKENPKMAGYILTHMFKGLFSKK